MQEPGDGESVPAVSELERCRSQLVACRVWQIAPEIARHRKSFADVADKRAHASIRRRRTVIVAVPDVEVPAVWAREPEACPATTSWATEGRLTTDLEHLHTVIVIITTAFSLRPLGRITQHSERVDSCKVIAMRSRCNVFSGNGTSNAKNRNF